jgi:hypothetical protein
MGKKNLRKEHQENMATHHMKNKKQKQKKAEGRILTWQVGYSKNKGLI